MARNRLKDPIEDPPISSSSSSSSSEEEDEETQTPQTQKNPTLNVKPIAAKPMDETSKTKKPRSKPLASPVKASSAKQPSESEQESKEVKRSKKKIGEEGSGSAAVVEEEVKKTGEDAKKKLFQRLFSEDDVLKAQLMYKVRRLRKKFENNAKGKNGEDRTFSKPHEQKIFELSKKIWGKEGITGKVESSAVKSNGNSKALAALKAELLSSPDKKVDGGEPMEVDKKGSKSWGSSFDKRFGVGGLEDVLKHGLDMIGGENRAALEKWMKLQVAELELFLQRNELIKEQVKLILEFYKSEDA